MHPVMSVQPNIIIAKFNYRSLLIHFLRSNLNEHNYYLYTVIGLSQIKCFAASMTY